MRERSILVTGGFGFIGSTLVEKLLCSSGTHVHVVDNLSTSPIDVDSFLELLGHPPNLSFDLCSISDYCRSGRDRPRFDEVYHLASVVGPVGVLEHAGRITRMIVDDIYDVMDIARKDGSRLLDVSTSEVYGGGRDGYCSEGFTKIIPPKVTVRLEYAIGKLAAETALVNTCRVSGLHATIIRPFNVAGPRQAPAGGFVLPRFAGQALRREPLTVYNDGSMLRAFTHVQDIANGLMLTMERGESGEAYNLGNPANKITILEMARRVIELSGGYSEVQFVDPKTLFGPLFEEANDKFPDSRKVTEAMGWHPKFGVDDVIRDTLQYIRDGRKA